MFLITWYSMKKLPKSIAEPLLLDQMRRCMKNYIDALDNIHSEPYQLHDAFGKLIEAKRAYIRVTGEHYDR